MFSYHKTFEYYRHTKTLSMPKHNLEMSSLSILLTFVAIPPTNIRLGITVPYLGTWLARPLGVIDGLRLGESSSD